MSEFTDALDSLAEHVSTLAADVEALRDKADEVEEELAGAGEQLDDEKMDFRDSVESVLGAIERLHEEAHGDRTPVRLCTAPACRDLRNALSERLQLGMPTPKVSV